MTHLENSVLDWFRRHLPVTCEYMSEYSWEGAPFLAWSEDGKAGIDLWDDDTPDCVLSVEFDGDEVVLDSRVAGETRYPLDHFRGEYDKAVKEYNDEEIEGILLEYPDVQKEIDSKWELILERVKAEAMQYLDIRVGVDPESWENGDWNDDASQEEKDALGEKFRDELEHKLFNEFTLADVTVFATREYDKVGVELMTNHDLLDSTWLPLSPILKRVKDIESKVYDDIVGGYGYN